MQGRLHIAGQMRECAPGRRRFGPHYDVNGSLQLGQQMCHDLAQTALHEIADDRITDRLADDKPDPGRLASRDTQHVHDHRSGAISRPPSTRLTKFSGCAHSLHARKHGQADSEERPLARRVAMIPRPARVRMRTRNPCFFARRRLLGWKVRFVMIVSSKILFRLSLAQGKTKVLTYRRPWHGSSRLTPKEGIVPGLVAYPLQHAAVVDNLRCSTSVTSIAYRAQTATARRRWRGTTEQAKGAELLQFR